MTPQKIISIIERYEQELAALGIPRRRMDIFRTVGSLTHEEALAHAHYLCDGVRLYAVDPNRQRKTGSHLAAVQMCLSFANWYTVHDLMQHNKS